jgi:hypothetical protein
LSNITELKRKRKRKKKPGFTPPKKLQHFYYISVTYIIVSFIFLKSQEKYFEVENCKTYNINQKINYFILQHLCMYLRTPGNGLILLLFSLWVGVSSGTPYPHVMQV